MLSTDWHIRPVLPSDSVEQLTDLIHAAFAPHLAEDLRFVGTHQTIAETSERLASGHAFVATVNGELVGTVIARPPKPQASALLYRDPHTWSFSQLAVAPQLKGRGLGRALHDTAVRLAAQRGAKTMALDTAAPAKRLISLYESWGYRIVGSADWRPKTNYESVLMARPITADGTGSPPDFDTLRLRVRRGRHSDAQSLFERYTGRADASRFLQRAPHTSVQDTVRFIQSRSVDASIAPLRRLAWLIEERASGDVVGVVVVTLDDDGVAELHFGLSPDRWGRGYATEACAPVVGCLSRHPEVKRIHSFCDPENVGSIRVVEKLGFKPMANRTRNAVLPALGSTPRAMPMFVYEGTPT